MGRIRVSMIAAVVLLAAPEAPRAQPAEFKLDPTHLTIAAWVSHIGYQRQLVVFRQAAGTLRYDAAARRLVDLEVRIDARSVWSNDAKRDEHLRGPDFLNVREHPELVFKSTEATGATPTSGTIGGTLTLVGQTRPVRLDVTLNKAAEYPFAIDGRRPFVLGLSARTTLKRSDFGMTYGVAGDLVGDAVEIVIEAEAIRVER